MASSILPEKEYFLARAKYKAASSGNSCKEVVISSTLRLSIDLPLKELFWVHELANNKKNEIYINSNCIFIFIFIDIILRTGIMQYIFLKRISQNYYNLILEYIQSLFFKNCDIFVHIFWNI